MNKKKLSVVMAGAMLASSVAPVLAATAVDATNNTYEADLNVGKKYEVNGSNRGILVRDLRNLLTEHVYANEASNKYLNVNSDGTAADSNSVAGTSVYEVRIGSTASTVGTDIFNTVDSESIEKMEKAINAATVGTEIWVIDRGHDVKNGKYYIHAQEDKTLSDSKLLYTAETLKKAYDDYLAGDKVNTYAAIESMDYDAENNKLTVHTRAAADEFELKTIELTVGSEELDFTRPIDSFGDVQVKPNSADWSNLAGFENKTGTVKVKKGQPIDAKRLAVITVSDVDTKHVVKLSDLYDGLLLTEKGQELLATTKEYTAYTSNIGRDVLKIKSLNGIKDNKNGIFTFDLALTKYSADKDGNRDTRLSKTLITVSSNNKAQLEILHKWLSQGKANVEVLAGDNRYETAVKVAKENASIEDVAVNGNIVLVNGGSLVDGLAAAPLAASVWNDGGTDKIAPILLTESNSIPKATKKYMKELIAAQTVGALDKVTIYLVGGTSVISKSVENELKEIGFRIVRAGGANREETSLKVAEVMLKDGHSSVNVANPFIVGGNGEADAMSIASIAADKKQPIIVSKTSGLSEDALNTLVDWKNDQYDNKGITATIIGGENAVSKETEEALADKGLKVSRIAGNNRKSTNAAVIDAYYATNSVDRIVVSKDGIARKGELIDALTATSLAVKDHGPIVLATNNLSTEQINALEKKTTRTSPVYAYQVGHGVARDVLKTIAQRLNLAK